MATATERLDSSLAAGVRWLLWLVPVCALAANDVLAPDLPFDHVAWKHFAFRIVVELAAALWIPLAVLNPRYRPRRSGLAIAVAAVMACALVSDLGGIDPQRSIWTGLERMLGLVGLLHFGAFFVIATSTLDRRGWRVLFTVSVVCCSIACVEAITQYFGAPLLFDARSPKYLRLDARMGNPVYLAIYVQMHLFITALLAVEETRRSVRIAFLATGALMIVVLYGTGTRAAWLFTLLGFGLAAGWMVWRSDHDGIRRLAKVAAGIAAALMLTIVALALLDPEFLHGMPALGRLSAALDAIHSRFLVWQIAWAGFLEHPVLGWGEYSFERIFDAHYDPRLHGEGRWWDHSHNALFEWLIAGGIVGAIAWTALYATAFATLLRSASTSSLPVRGLIAGGILAQLGFSMTQPGTFAGLLTVFALFARAAQRAGDPPSSTGSTTLAWLALVVTLPLAGVAMKTLNIDHIRAAAGMQSGDAATALDPSSFVAYEARERFVLQAINLQFTDLDPTVVAEQLRHAEAAARSGARRHPDLVRPNYLAGLLLTRSGQYAAALPFLEHALELCPQRQLLLFELGDALFGLGRKAESVAAYQRALDADPTNKKVLAQLGIAAVRAGDEATANRVLAELMPADPRKFDVPPKLIDALHRNGWWQHLIAIYEPLVGERRRRRAANIEEDLQDVTVPYMRLAAAYLGAGRKDDATATITELMAVNPAFERMGRRITSRIAAGEPVSLWRTKRPPRE